MWRSGEQQGGWVWTQSRNDGGVQCRGGMGVHEEETEDGGGAVWVRGEENMLSRV